jgi:hypothetical protein
MQLARIIVRELEVIFNLLEENLKGFAKTLYVVVLRVIARRNRSRRLS